ncbi:MAG: DUF6382 domain-containing protein [Acetatifactor sp.]
MMLQTEYIRSLNCNYERILLDRKPEERKYQFCILNRGGIRGLLPCSLRYINGLAYLYYDISSKQNVAQLYSTRSITREWLKDFMWGMKQVRQELERFLLDCRNIVWYPEQIFQDLESNIFSFLYIPYYEGECSFGAFLEFLVEHINYDDEALVECVYHMHEQYGKNGEVYLQTQIFGDMEKLKETDRRKENSMAADSRGEGNTEPEAGKSVAGRKKDSTMDDWTESGQTTADNENSENKKGIFGIFEGRKKKNQEQRENYRQSMHRAMEGCAVAEETAYEETEYGQTIYMEIGEDTQGKVRGIYLPDGNLLSNLDKPVITIGKKKEEADVVLENSSVSRIHARIIKEKEYYYLEDLNSTNGTFKNGLRLQPYEKRRLEEGDDIRCGRVLFVFR